MRRGGAILLPLLLLLPWLASGDETAADYAIAARRLQDEGDLDGALLGYSKAIALAQTTPDYYLARGRLRMELGRHAEAAVDFKIATLFDDDGECVDAWFWLGQARAVLGRYQEALDALNRPELAGDADPEVCFWRGLVCQCLGDAQGAVDFYTRTLDLEGTRTEARRGLAEALATLGRLEEAIREFDAAVAMEPENPLGHCARGFAHLQAGLAAADREPALQRAERDFRTALALDGKGADAYGGLALVELARRQPQAAVDRLTAGLTHVGEADKEVLRWRLWLLFAATGRAPEAKALLARLAAEEPPDSCDPVNVVAGRCQLEVALKAKPQDAIWHTEQELGLAMKALAAGDREAARAHLTFCRRRPYGFPGALACLLETALGRDATTPGDGRRP